MRILRLMRAFETFTALNRCGGSDGSVELWCEFCDCDILTEVAKKLRDVSDNFVFKPVVSIRE